MSYTRPTQFSGVLALSAMLFIAGCGSKAPTAAAPAQEPEVGVVTLTAEDVPLLVSLSGRTSAFQRAEVRPQVTGIIEARLFEEGAAITADSQLYQIDDASYKAAYQVAEAEVGRAKANLVAVSARESRLRELLKTKAVSQQDYDDIRANLGQAQAAVKAAEAMLETARVNLNYTRVLAPISGVIGKSSVTEGALVTSGQAQVLATIQQLDPIYVDISQSADELLRLRRQMLAGKVSQSEAAGVRLMLEDGSQYEHTGKLQFAEVGVSESTGTVLLRAIFPNPDGLLLPGMFVRAELEEGVRSQAVLVSQRGITRDRLGEASALVVNAEGLVELRQVKIARALGDQWLVEAGLSAGDQVIVEGLQRVRVGMKVRAVPAQIANSAERG